MAISAILPFNSNALIRFLAQNTVKPTIGTNAFASKPLFTVSTPPSAEDAAVLVLSTLNPDLTASLASLSSVASNMQASLNPASPLIRKAVAPAANNPTASAANNILQNNLTAVQASLNPVSLLIQEAVAPAVSNPTVTAATNILQNNLTAVQTTLNPVSPPIQEAVSPDPAQINLDAAVSTGVLQTNENLAQSVLGITNPKSPLDALLSAPSDLQAAQRVNATEHTPGRSQYFFTAYFKIMNAPIAPITGAKVNITA